MKDFHHLVTRFPKHYWLNEVIRYLLLVNQKVAAVGLSCPSVIFLILTIFGSWLEIHLPLVCNHLNAATVECNVSSVIKFIIWHLPKAQKFITSGRRKIYSSYSHMIIQDSYKNSPSKYSIVRLVQKGCALVSEMKKFIYSMIPSMMANTTQEQEKSAAESNSISEEVCPLEKEDVQPKGEAQAEVEPEVEVDVEPVKGERAEDVNEGGGGDGGGDGGGGGGKGEAEVEAEAEAPAKEGTEEEVAKEETEEVAKEETEEVAKEETEEEVAKEGTEEEVAKERTEEVSKEGTEEEVEVKIGGKQEEEDEVPEEDEGADDIDDEEEEEEDEEEEDDEVDAEEEKVHEGKIEKTLDHDQDRRNPQYIPKGGAFYEHDNRTSLEDVENKDPLEVDRKKKVWKESKESERWLHDWYKESEQTPKTKAEIIQIYGYDIRKEEAPPRARRRRKYGRGPDKYDRNWEDEQAYMVKQNGPSRKGRKKNFGKEEFPPLPNRKNDSSVEKPVAKSQMWKKTEEEPPKNRMPKVNNQDKHPAGPPPSRNEQTPQRTNALGPYSNKKIPPQSSRKINEDDIKPFRNDKNKWKSNNFRRGKQDEIPKPNKPKLSRQGEAQTPRSEDSNKNSSGDSDIAHMTEGFCQMTFHNKHSSMRDRQDSNDIAEQELDSPANRLNPKRYSKNRKSFTGFFPPEDIVEIDPTEMKQIQQEQQQQQQQQQQQKNQHMNLPQQPLNIQSVIRRYPSTYNGSAGYMATRPIIPGIPNQGMSPQGLQQALSPQGIPQQALSPQVPGLQPIELQQGPLPPQPNFVPPIYIDIDPHYGTSDMMGAYTGYASYSASQPNEMYQPSGGITYYSTECQNSNQIRPPPARRQKAAIPIVPPSE